jgi:hypothetical protein
MSPRSLLRTLGAVRRGRAVQALDPADRRALDTLHLRTDGPFPHVSHLRVARLYLGQLPLGDALAALVADLRRFARHKGAEQKYHHTITVAFLLLIRARLARAPVDESFEAFLARNPDLASAGCLDRFYSRATLDSPAARADFVFPDRL